MRSAILVLLLVVMVSAYPVSAGRNEEPRLKIVSYQLNDLQGEEVGEITLSHNEEGLIIVEATLERLARGFYSMQAHDKSVCDAAGEVPFASSGEVVQGPRGFDIEFLPIYVMANGRATLSYITDLVDFGVLVEDYGSSLILYALPSTDAEGAAAVHSAEAVLVSNEIMGEAVACGTFGVK